jgi:energy-coupling factor transporter ATP-binding protein EcfA2
MSTEVERTLKAMAAERSSHLNRFAGREDFLRHLLTQFDSRKEAGGYLLLLGHEGSGKSALCAMLSQRLAARTSELPKSSQVERLVHLFPWLPGCLLCVCKQVASPAEVVEALLAQAELLLGESLREEASVDGSGVDFEAFVLPSGGLADPATAIQQLRSHAAQRMKRQQRWLLYAFEQIRQRFGQALIIVDAADELSLATLDFLPSVLPRGVSVLLSSRPGRLASWCSETLRALPIEMQHLSRPETALVTGIDDEISDAARQFNDRYLELSGELEL